MTLADQIEIACLLEATAPKLGNVHPGAPFHDATYDDFVTAARLVATPLSQAAEIGIGRAIHEAVRQTREAVGTNVNLGIVLLLAPLAAVPKGLDLASGVQHVLANTTVSDAEQVYAAIRLAKPGGLGDAQSQDVHAAPTITLTAAMTLAADWDMIAEQYATGFRYVIEDCVSWLVRGLELATASGKPGLDSVLMAICFLQRAVLSSRVDSLIVRKCGPVAGEEVRERFRQCCPDLEGGPFGVEAALPPDLKSLDEWLRTEGHRRNPGSTADLIAAAIFVAIRRGLLQPPSREEIAEIAGRIATYH